MNLAGVEVVLKLLMQARESEAKIERLEEEKPEATEPAPAGVARPRLRLPGGYQHP